MLASIEKWKTCFSVDGDRVSVRFSPLDDAFQHVLPALLHPRFLHICRYTLMAGRPCESPVYDSLRKALYWAHIANEACTEVRNCAS